MVLEFSHAPAIFDSLVVHAHKVQHAVNQQVAEFRIQRNRVLAGLSRGPFHRDHHITEDFSTKLGTDDIIF